MSISKLSVVEKIVTGLAASVVVAGFVVGCTIETASEMHYPKFRIYASDLRPSGTARWVKVRHMVKRNTPYSQTKHAAAA